MASFGIDVYREYLLFQKEKRKMRAKWFYLGDLE